MAKIFEGTKQNLRNNWKALLWGVIPIVILAIVFALPIKVVPVTTSETYMTTELKSESYTEQETYQVEEPYTTTETKTETVYDSYVSGYSGSYSFVPKPGATISVSIQGSPYYYYSRVYNPWDGAFPPFFLEGATRMVIKMTYPEQATRTVTKTRDVVKYREVPVQVEKERTVTKYYRVSIWAYLFWDR